MGKRWRGWMVFAAGVLVGMAAVTRAQEGERPKRAPRYDEISFERFERLEALGDQIGSSDLWATAKTDEQYLEQEAGHLQLMYDCRNYEDAVRREMELHPGSLSHVYLYLWARSVHDMAMERVLGHELGKRGYVAAAGHAGGRTIDRQRLRDDAGFASDYGAIVGDRQ